MSQPPTHHWFVVFPARSPGLGRPRWWQRLLAPRWRHVLACRAEGERTLVVDHGGSHLRIEMVDAPIGAFIAAMQAEADAWVLSTPPMSTPASIALRPPLTCVEAVKALLGIRDPCVLTPRQLARRLRRLGAVPVLPAT